VKFVIK